MAEPIPARYLRHLIEKWLKEGDGRSAAELARQAGVTPTHISTIRSSDRGIGWKTLQGLAKAFDISLGQLETDAKKWAAVHPEPVAPSAPRVERDERYPNRSKAAEAARILGIGDEAIRIVMGISLKANEDPTPLDWLEDMKAEDRRLRRGVVITGPSPTRADEEAMRPGIHRVDPKHLKKPGK